MSDIVQKLWGFCHTLRHDVREHLVKNLSMDEQDFDLTPLLAMRGGRAKTRKVFGDLSNVVGELNEVVAT